MIIEELKKYAKGDISAEEMEKVASSVESASDSELEEFISAQWQAFDAAKPLPKCKRKGLYPHDAIRQSRYVSPWRFAGIAASLAVLATAVFVAFNSGRASYAKMADAEVVMKADQEGTFSLALPDGSNVTLNSRSEVSYPSSFGMGRRELTLNGEGYFDIAKDPSKEFVVHTKGMDITVHGTRFNVFAYDNGNREEMSLIEGSVTVDCGGRQVHMESGQKLVLDGHGVTVKNADCVRDVAWMDGVLVFMHEPLSRVFDSIERKYGVVVTCSPEINLDDRYTGSFDDFRVADVLDVLKMHYGFQCVYNGNNVMIIP